MLLLLFYLGNERYAVDGVQVVEIIPQVNLRKIFGASDYVAGIFNYRGMIVPVVDLCQLIQGNHGRLCLSSRIIIVSYPDGKGQFRPLGLMAERVTDTLHKTDKDLVPIHLQGESTAYLGEMIMDDQGMIQRLCLEKLLSADQRRQLLFGQADGR
jgi:chemotaxis-related protein WspB